MLGLTHIDFNRLDLMMTDVPDIVDVVVGTPPGTSDHCFVSCAFRVEQSVLEYVQCQIYSLLKATNQLGQCRQCSQELHMVHHFEVS